MLPSDRHSPELKRGRRDEQTPRLIRFHCIDPAVRGLCPMTDHDKPKKDADSRFDQIIGFVGAAGFIALLVYTQAQN